VNQSVISHSSYSWMLHLHIVGPGCVDQFVPEDNVILLTAGQ